MATPQTDQTRLYKTTIQDLNNPALLARATELAEDGQDIEKALRIASVLQTTLDLRKILDLFFIETGRWIQVNGIAYEHPERGIQHLVGEQEKHTITYRLAITDQSLGEITFSRKRKFSNKENTALEYLLCGLVYPLRNAITYERAVLAALKDPLTGINNRAAMDAAMLREVELARRHGNSLSLIAIDIDFFKRVNDSYGHASGDCVLRAVATAITETVRGSDMVFRYGGEEFMVLLSSTGKKGALLLADRIRQRVQETEIICGSNVIKVTVSLGVSCLDAAETGQTLFLKADKALYDAKANGRNCVRYSLK